MMLRPKARVLFVLSALLALTALAPAAPGSWSSLSAQEAPASVPPATLEETRDTALPIEGQQPESATVQETGFMAAADRAMGRVNSIIGAVFFYDILFWDEEHVLPLVVFWLVVAAVFLTFRMGFINFRAFKHAINVTAGKYSDPKHAGEVSHFQALTAALSATVGLGNIAGVAIAISIGGPGATFWMIIAGLIGMTSKFTE